MDEIRKNLLCSSFLGPIATVLDEIRVPPVLRARVDHLLLVTSRHTH